MYFLVASQEVLGVRTEEKVGKQQQQCLFVSFTGLCHAMRDEVNSEDLDRGLFYFGCGREHVIYGVGESEANRAIRDNPKEAEYLHGTIRAAVLKAEAEGRAAWHGPKSEEVSYEEARFQELNELLKTNGFSPLRRREDDIFSGYSYPRVEKLVEENKVPLRVIRA